MAKRLMFSLDDDVVDLLVDLAGSPRKQSRFLNDLIRQAAAERSNGQAALRQELRDIAGTLATATARLRELSGDPVNGRKGVKPGA